MRMSGFVFAAAVSGTLACGDGADIVPDAPGDVRDARGGGFPPDSLQGGSVMFELIHFDAELQATLGLPSGVTTLDRVIGYFMNHQTPEAFALPVPGGCTNLDETRAWPMFVGDPRVDLDVGTVAITGKNPSDVEVAITVPKQAAGIDAIGRAHDIFYQRSNIGGEAVVGLDRAYTVTFGGHDPIPATTFDGALFMPGAFDVTEPALEEDGPLIAGSDFTVGWTPAPKTNLPPGTDLLGIVWLADTNGVPTHICTTLHALGTFTIAGSAIAEYREIAAARGTSADAVVLRRDALVRQIRRLPNGEPDNQRDIDMLGIHSWAQRMDVTAAALR